MTDLLIDPLLHLILSASPLSSKAVVSPRGPIADSRTASTSTRSHRCFKHQEVRLRYLEGIEAGLKTVIGSREAEGREDIGVKGTSVRVNQLDNSFGIRIFGDDIGGEDVPQKVFPILGLQFELERIANGNRGGGTSLVLDQKANSAVEGVLCGEVLNGNWLTRPKTGRCKRGAQDTFRSGATQLPGCQKSRSHPWAR